MSECPTNNIHVTCDTCYYAFAGTVNINFVLSSNDDRDKGVKYFCSVNCLLDYVEMQFNAKNHIADVGKMVSKKLPDSVIEACGEIFTPVIDSIIEKTNGHRKLKPVDENCLYKRVKILRGDVIGVDGSFSSKITEGILVSIDHLDESEPGVKVPFIVIVTLPKSQQEEYWLQDGFNSTRMVVYCTRVERIPDHDYDDGGNYL